jgi:hypothetical protein
MTPEVPFACVLDEWCLPGAGAMSDLPDLTPKLGGEAARVKAGEAISEQTHNAAKKKDPTAYVQSPNKQKPPTKTPRFGRLFPAPAEAAAP